MDQNATNPQQQNAAKPTNMAMRFLNMCCNFQTATELFDVDTVDVTARIKSAATQFFLPDRFRNTTIGTNIAKNTANNEGVKSNHHRPSNEKGPDLYGPFWIAMTLVFVLSVTSNLSAYRRHTHDAKHSAAEADDDTATVVDRFDYDITHLIHAFAVVIQFVLVVPTIFWLFTNCLGISDNSSNSSFPSWSLWVCCYGYSQIPILLGCSVVWIVPYWIYHWVVLGGALSASALLILRNLSTPLMNAGNTNDPNGTNDYGATSTTENSNNHAKVAIILIAISCVHLIFWFIFSIRFYKL